MQGEQQAPLDGNAVSAATAAAAPAVPQLPPAPGLILPPAAQLHVPWTLDQFVWDPSALTAAPGGPLPTPSSAAGVREEEHSGRTGASASGPASAAAAVAGAARSAASAHVDQAGSALAAALTAGQPLPEWPVSPPLPPSPPAGGKLAFCQVCHESVSGLKDYYGRYKICPAHCVMPGIVKDGRVLRFCQQCGRFQPIEDFDESKRTCRRKLEWHNSRRRNLTKVRAAGSGTAATSAHSSAALTARKPKAKRARAATPGPVSDVPTEHLVKQEQPEQQQVAGQALPAEVARALELPQAGGGGDEAAAAHIAAAPPADAAAAAAGTEGAQQQIPMELDAMLSSLAVEPPAQQAQQGSPPGTAQLQQPLVLPSPVAGTGGLLGLEASPMLASPVLPGLSGSPGGAVGGKLLQPPPTVPAGVAAKLQQRQPAAPGAAPKRAVAGTEFDSLIADLFGSGPPNSSNAWLAEVLLAPTDTSPPAGSAPPMALAPLPPPQQQQQQQSALPLLALSGYPMTSLMPATDSLATTAASGAASQPPGAAIKAEPACEAPGPDTVMLELPPFPAQDTGIGGLQAAQLHMQPPTLAAAAPGQQMVPQPMFGGAAPPLPLQPDASAPHAMLPPLPASLEQALGIMGQQPPGMAPVFQPPGMQPPHVQLSLKLFGVTPEALPPELRSELQSLLGSPMLEGYLRPGCTHLTLEALLQDEQQLAVLRSMGVAGAVQHLLQTTSGLGHLLHRAPVLVQLGDELAVVAEGKVQRVLKLSACKGVLPRISSIRPLVLRASCGTNQAGACSAATEGRSNVPTCRGEGTDAACQRDASVQQCAGGERILVQGSALLGEQCRLLVRSDGTYPLVEILDSSGPLGAPRRALPTTHTAGDGSVFAQEDEWLEIRLPKVHEGLYTVEAQRGGLLGCSRTLLALQDEQAVNELRTLETSSADFTDVDAFLHSVGLVLRHQQLQQQLQAAQAINGGGTEHTDGSMFSDGNNAAEVADGEINSDGKSTAAAALAQLAARAARAGVAAAASRGWPGVAALLLPSIMADGRSAADAVHAMDALCPPTSPLLHLATASRSVQLLQVLAAWGRQQGYTWPIAAPAGPTALTPLHLAAAAQDSPLFKALFEVDPAGASSAWHTAKTSDGFTPAAFAALAKQRRAAAAAEAAGAKAAPHPAPQPATGAALAAAGAGSAAEGGQPTNGHLAPSTARLAVPAPLLIKQAEPPSPKSPNGVAVSEAERSPSSISSGGSYCQLAALAAGLSDRLGIGIIAVSPAAALVPAPSLQAAFANGHSDGRTLSPRTPDVKQTRLSSDAPTELAPAATDGCKALVVPPPSTAATLAVRAGPAVAGCGISSTADEDGAAGPASSCSPTADGGSHASQSGSPLRLSESPPLLKFGSPVGEPTDSDGDSLVEGLEEANSERGGNGSAKGFLSCPWDEVAAAAAAKCDCCSALADHDSGCTEVLESVRASLGADGQAEVEVLLHDLSRNDAACATAAALAMKGAWGNPSAAVATTPKKVADEEAEEAAEGHGSGAPSKCSKSTESGAAGHTCMPWLVSLGAAAANRWNHIVPSSLRRR